MFCRVAVNLAGRGLKNLAMQPFGKSQHVIGAENAGLGGLHRVPLIMNRRCRAGQIINLIDLHEERMRDIVAKQFKMLMVQQMFDVPAGAGKKIIDAEDLATGFK